MIRTRFGFFFFCFFFLLCLSRFGFLGYPLSFVDGDEYWLRNNEDGGGRYKGMISLMRLTASTFNKAAVVSS